MLQLDNRRNRILVSSEYLTAGGTPRREAKDALGTAGGSS